MAEQDNIRIFPGWTSLDLPVDRVCDAAKATCTALLILGTDTAGEAYCASTTLDRQQLLWWIEEFKMRLLTDELTLS